MQNLDTILGGLSRELRNENGCSIELSTRHHQATPTNPLRSEPMTTAFPKLNERDSEFRKKLFAMDETHHEVAKFTLALEGFLRRALHNDRSKGTHLLISGNTGTGKTTACRKVADQFRIRAIDAMCEGNWGGFRVPGVEVRDWAQLCGHPNFDEVLDDLSRAALVLLDDIGAETDRFKQGEVTDKLRRTLEATQNRWVLATTNLTPKAMGERYDARVTSRLAAYRRVNLFTAPDYRPKLATGKGEL